ncbi:MAG: ATPase, T2SS/T4P/T4SS family [Chloroflexota bacterium]|nr:ATPase, T2SS/T4P/T4SS family [Chloroflexota bacterium]
MARSPLRHIQNEAELRPVTELITSSSKPGELDAPHRRAGEAIAYSSGELDSDAEVAVVLMSRPFATHPDFTTARRRLFDHVQLIFDPSSIHFATTTPDIIRRLYRLHDVGATDDAPAHSASASEILARIERTVREAMERNASDIHITVSATGTVVRLRVDSTVHQVATYSVNEGMEMVRAIYQTQIETRSGQGEFNPHAAQDAKIITNVTINDRRREVHLRYAHNPNHDGLHVAMRLSSDTRLRTTDLSELGYLPGQVALIRRMLRVHGGLVVFAGPVGSGKTTSLAALLTGHLEEVRGRKVVLSIEDPVEVPIPGADQAAVVRDPDRDVSPFADALRSAMRRDPDIVLLGETRDQHTAVSLAYAVVSGHDIYTTTHARSAWRIIDRLEDLGRGLGDNPLSRPRICHDEFLLGMVYQRLAPLTCPTCAIPAEDAAGAGIPDMLRRHTDTALASTFGPDMDLSRVAYRAAVPDCPDCHGSGTRGRAVCAEVVMPTDEEYVALARGDTPAAVASWRARRDVAQGFGMSAHEIALYRVARGELCPTLYESIFQPLEDRPDLSRAPARLTVVGDDPRPVPSAQ